MDPVTDGNSDFLGGQDASQVPDRIAQNAYAAGINVSAKGGALSPRWGWESIELEFPEGGIKGTDGRTRTWKQIFESGKFQLGAPYTIGDDSYFITVVNGVIFLTNSETFQVSIITLAGESLDFGADRLNWTPADKYFAIFDYPARPVILEGIKARRSDKKKQEIPISKLGAFNSNRVFITNAGNEFTAGDPVGAKYTNAPISFIEVLTQGTNFFGQIFKISSNYNNEKISAFAFLQQTDTSTGIGPLLVATKNIIGAYLANTPREQWQQEQFGSVILFNGGIASQTAQVNVGSDLFFQSGDGGVRILSMARDAQHRFSKVPISQEVQNWLKFWDIDLVKFGVITYFKNKILVGANPFRTDAVDINGNPTQDYAHAGMVVLELDNMTSFGEASKPAWAGLWTGVMPMAFIPSNDQLFIVSKDGQLSNRIYRARPDRTYDVRNNAIFYIHSRVYTRGYDCQNALLDKELQSVALEVADVAGPLRIRAAYLPSHGNKYVSWAEPFERNIKWKECNIQVGSPTGYAKQSFKEVNFGSPPPNACNEATRELLAVFRHVQVRIDITAKDWTIQSIQVNAKLLPKVQNNINTCVFQSDEEIAIPDDCNNDWNLEALAA